LGSPSVNQNLKDFPPIILWAWERPENLKFIDSEKFGVAFLAQTLILKNDRTIFEPRRQPLIVSDETFLIAVTRIETNRINSSDRPSLSDSQRQEIIDFVKQSADLPNVKAVQIDFDARLSERNFYRSLLGDLRTQLPENLPLTMTALASWCAFDDWMTKLPVDTAVPMAFQMGLDEKPIRDFLSTESDWRQPLCRESYGLALGEPFPAQLKTDRRIYVFNKRAWKPEDLEHLPRGILP
jgi:hypothetical protein